MESLISPTNRCLLVAAAPKEADAVCDGFGIVSQELAASGDAIGLDECFDLIRCGVGKAPAAAATARALTLGVYGSVISVGIAGALPGGLPPKIGQSVCAVRSCFSDEGVGAPAGFVPMSELGFGPFAGNKMGIDHNQGLTAMLSAAADVQGVIATVSWCSGDDGCARGVVSRTGAIAEAMEGAAVAVAAQMIDAAILTGELRVISNTTGNRDEQVWDLERALKHLSDLMRSVRVLGHGC